MSQASIRLVSPKARHKAAAWAWSSDPDTLVTFTSPDKRTAAQNAAMWAALTDIAEQVEWDGQMLPPDDWKLLFLAEMHRGERMVKSLSGRGYINLNTSSSALRVGEFAELLEAIHKFSEAMGVVRVT